MKRYFPVVSAGLLLFSLLYPGSATIAQNANSIAAQPEPGQVPPHPPRLPEAVIPAFPGAWGGGMFTSGGRGGKVIAVTNLNDSGPGSFRAALETKGPRIVVFRVAGTLKVNDDLNIKHPDITIAGQSAPGDGICVADYPVYITGNNVIVRYMRFRLGDKNQNKGFVDGSGGDDAFGGAAVNNIIIDHVTASWSDDEALTIYRGDNLTIQWCMMSEPLNYSYHFEAGGTDYQEHGYGGI